MEVNMSGFTISDGREQIEALEQELRIRDRENDILKNAVMAKNETIYRYRHQHAERYGKKDDVQAQMRIAGAWLLVAFLVGIVVGGIFI